MKGINANLLSALCATCIGALLVIYPNETQRWLVIAIGTGFLLPGLVAIAVYLLRKREAGTTAAVPYVGIGCTLFGLLLICMPQNFVAYAPFVIAAFLCLVAINRLAYLWQFRSQRPIAAVHFVFGVVVALAGLFVFLQPLAPQSAYIYMYILGIGCALYGLTEVFNLVAFRKLFGTTTAEPAESTEAVTETQGEDSPEAMTETPKAIADHADATVCETVTMTEADMRVEEGDEKVEDERHAANDLQQ